MKNIPHDLGVYANTKQVFIYSHVLFKESDLLHLGVSTDGINFKPSRKIPVILTKDGKKENTRYCSDFRISKYKNILILLYKYSLNNKSLVCSASSKDGVIWKKEYEFPNISNTSMIVPDFLYEKQYLLYSGEEEIHFGYSHDLTQWNIQRSSVLSPRVNFFDNHPLILSSVLNHKQGILVFYYVKKSLREGNSFLIGAAICDKKNPHKVLWRSDKPLWEQNELWRNKHVYPMGSVLLNENIYFYFGVEGDAVYAVSLGKLQNILKIHTHKSELTLQKHEHNPIISPVLKHVWESSATFNTAAIHADGKVHFVYRAMGPQNTSVLGYASSSDGIHIDTRLKTPIYYPTEPFEVPVAYPSIQYMSGGGYGGCEDPRITQIDNMLYMTYVAYNGRDAPKVALTSIQLNDFLKKRWIWAKPKIISSPHHVNKNCVIFPEKINGKYVIMHRVFPNILIDIVDDLDFNSVFLTGHFKISPRLGSWDSRKLGAGAPPIKTKDGWLLIYQAVDDRDPNKYKIGAMILDINDPTKVLYRPQFPILTPDKWYENEGFKAGVAYPCGAVVKDNQLFVYYGGADTVICVATTPLDEFLQKIKNSSKINKDKPFLKRIPHAPNYNTRTPLLAKKILK